MLDYIEVLIHRIPDDNQYKEELLTKYKKYRALFESSPRDTNLRYFILKYVTELEAYVKDYSINAPIHDYENLPVLLEDKNNEFSDVVNLNEYVDILTNRIDNIDHIRDTKSLSTLTNHIQEEYEQIKIKNQVLDQKICKALFALMLKYITENEIEEAKKVAEKFDLDMRIYLINYLKPQIEPLKNAKKYNEAEFIWEYIYGNQTVNENNIEFWYFIAKLEGIIVASKDNNLNNNNNNNNNILAINEKVSIFDSIRHAFFKAKTSVKKLVIRNNYGKCNKEDIAKALEQICSFIKDNRYDLVFQNGITDISFFDSSTNIKDYKFDGMCLINVVLPTTAKTIDNAAFKDFPCIKSIDMSETNITSIGSYAFYNSSIEIIKFSKSLTKIGDCAFAHCRNIYTIDLNETNLTFIGLSAFRKSTVEDFYFPRTLREISSYCFAETKKLKEVNLQNTMVTKLSEGVFSNSAITRVYLPRTLDTIGQFAFSWCIFLEKLNFFSTKLKNIGNCPFYYSGLKKVKFPSDLIELNQHTFDKAYNLVFVDLALTSVEKIMPETFCDSNIRVVRLGAKTKNISKNAFRNCNDLAVIDISSCSLKECEHLKPQLSLVAKVNNKKINTVRGGYASLLLYKPNPYYILAITTPYNV